MKSEDQQRIFEQWTGIYSGILHHAANAFAEGDDREDLMQEILLAVWKAIPAFRNDCAVSTFLYRVCHNAGMYWRRSRNSYQRRNKQAALQQPSQARAEHDDRAHLLDRLYERIRGFHPVDRSLLLMWLDEVSYREMAAVHGITENTAGVRLNRAKARLIELMREEVHGSV